MRIEKVDINRINPAKYNPRKDLKPGDKEYEKLTYNLDYKGRTTGMKIMNDSMSTGDFLDFLASAFGSYLIATKDGASFYVFHNYVSQSIFEEALGRCGLNVTSQIVWAKNVFSMGSRYRSQHELCFYAHRHGVIGPWYGDKSQTTLWSERRPRANDIHPTMKPVELIQRALVNSSKAGDLVVDLFGGSGSTMIACEKTGRTCYSMELDPGYCDVIVERWEKFTGKKAELITKEALSV